MPQINISDELFEQLTRYCNESDNGPDDLLRAELLDSRFDHSFRRSVRLRRYAARRSCFCGHLHARA